MAMITIIFVLLISLIWLCNRIIQWRVRIAKIRRTMPVVPVLITPYALVRRLLPKKWQTYHADWQFQERKTFDNLSTDIIPLVCLFGIDLVYVSDADAIVEMAMNIQNYPKDLRLYRILDIYGRNVLTSEGAAWRLQRKITARPFSERNNQLVHDESVKQATQMMESWESQMYDNAVVIEKPRLETMKFALHVIMGAGFGLSFAWDSITQDIWPNHRLSFRDSIETVLHNLFPILLVPRFLWKLPFQRLREAEQGYNEFGAYMRELLEREKKLGDKSDGQNLLSALMKHSATDDDGEQGCLNDQEIIGNTFIFLIAGHETTYFLRVDQASDNSAHTLLYAFIMLAIHPEIQDTLFKEIHQTVGDRLPVYDDFQNLVYPLCLMFETLRMFPPVHTIPKCTLNREQMLLGKYYIPKNTTVHFDTIHLHRNPKYWGSDVETFNPSRFDGRIVTKKILQNDTLDPVLGAGYDKIKMPVRGAFVPFSEGSRACLGRKFSQVEFVAFTVMVIQKWKVELKEDWTRERVWKAVDQSISVLTMFPPTDIPLVFRRRSH